MSARTVAAIDVGTNAVRLEIARLRPDGSLETVHQERDPVHTGEGVFATGELSPQVATRLLATLSRYGALCRRHRATVRAVATSALREAANQGEIVRRAAREAGLSLEVVSGQEEARLVCRGVLAGRAPSARALVIDIGGGSTEVAWALGERPHALHSVPLGAARLAETFDAAGSLPAERLEALREHAAATFEQHLPGGLPRAADALVCSGTLNALATTHGGARRLTLRRVERAVGELAALPLAERRRRFEARRAELIVAGAVILEAAMRHLHLEAVVRVRNGLRAGILLELAHRPG